MGRAESRVASCNITKYCACHAKWHERHRQRRTSRSRANAESRNYTSVPNTAPATLHTRRIFTKCCACHGKRHSHYAPRLPRIFLGCHHSTRPDNVEKTRSTTRGTRCACHAKYEDGVQSAEPAAKMQVPFGEPRQGIAPVTQNDSRHFFKQVGMSRSATPATQNTITRFETPTGTPRTRTKTRHAGSSKRAFLTRLPQIPHFVATKSTVPNEPQNLRPENRCSCEGSVTFSTCHKILQHLPRNLNVVVT